MSILKTIYLQHLNGSTPNATLDANGNMTVTGTVAGAYSDMFRNRIINGDMRIWQRGTSFTPSSVIFGADRFAGYKSGGSAGDYARSTDVPSGQGFTYSIYMNNCDLRQSIELPGAGLPGEFVTSSTWTLSFWIKGISATTGASSLGWADGVAAGSLNNWGGTTQSFSMTTSWTKVSQTFTVTGTPTGSQYAILLYFNAFSGYITGIQLEQGSVATPFERRLYTTELQLCQRYYQPLNTSGQFILMNYIDGTSIYQTNVWYKVSMRSGPTISTSTFTYRVGGSNTNGTVNSVTQASAGVNFADIRLNCPSAVNTVGTAGHCVLDSGWAASAEL